jgi:signal transduction histidine kinase
VIPDEPLAGIGSIKVKLGLLVAVSCVVAALFATIGDRAGMPLWLTLPVTVALALVVTQWLARGMTAPLREMTSAASRMAAGDYGQRVSTKSTDEVGELARAFNAMSRDLADADRQRRQLVATVSHELRTPLTAQRALLENLVDGVVQPDDAALRGALIQSERLSDLVGDLLDLSRIDAGVAPLRLEEVAVANLLQGAVTESELGSRNVSHVCRVVPDDLVVTADPARLAQLVANLLDNAARHSPPDGEIVLTATVLDDERWSLEVSDDGPGISADQAATIFSRFGTGDDAGGGTGLGLAIASWVCELHGGSISVLPTPAGAHGARLRAVLPRHTTTHARSVTALATEPTTEATMTTTPAPPPAAPQRASAAAGSAAPAKPDTPPFTDVLFGKLWPESGLGPQPKLLLGALLLGLIASVTLPDRRIGLAAGLVAVAAAGLMLSASTQKRNPWAIAFVAVGVGLAAMTVLRATEWIAVLSMLLAALLLAVTVTRARSLLSIPLSAASWVLAGIRGLPLLGRTLTATSRTPLLWPVLRTAAIAAVGLVLFGGLFASGDAIFGSWAQSLIPDLRWDSIIARIFIFVFVAGIALAGTYLALNPPRIADLEVPRGAPVRHRWEWLVPLGVVIALFAAFLVAQATAMWGGHEYLRETTGLSYAEYVHQGFGQLTTATFLTLVVVGIATRKAPQETASDRLVLRAALVTLCVLTLAVVASALYRMSLYQEAYGYTVLRVFVDGFELWLGLLIVLMIVAIVRLRGAWVPRAALLSGAVFFLAFGLMNPDGWVAQRNIDRFQQTGKLDTYYLAGLGVDATPAIVAGLDEKQAACVVTWHMEKSGDRSDGVLDWNLGRARAFDAVQGKNLTVDAAFCRQFGDGFVPTGSGSEIVD